MENKPESQKTDSNEVVWKDRKRFMGMPLSFTRYYIKSGRFYVSKGLLNSEENELLLYRIMDIKLNRSLVNKIFGVGSITLFTADKTDPELKIIRIKHSEKVRDTFSNMVEEARAKMRIRGKEIYGVGDVAMEGDIDNLGL